MASRSPKRRRPLVDRADSHTNELPHSPSPSPSRSSAPRRRTALNSNSPHGSGKPLIYADADADDDDDDNHHDHRRHVQAPSSPPKRPLPIPPIASSIPVLTPSGWRHSQGSSTLIDTVSNCAPSVVLDVPDELDPAYAAKTAAVSADCTVAATLAQSPTPQTPHHRHQYADQSQYQSENNVPGLQQHRRGVNLKAPQWDDTLRVAPLQSRRAESEELFETPSSGVITNRNSLDELIADIARFHDGLSEAEHEYSSPVQPGLIGTISSNSPISVKAAPQYPRSISSSSSNCFPRRDYPESSASGSPNLASNPDIDTPQRASLRLARVGVPKSVLKQKEVHSSKPLLDPSDDPFTDHIEPGAADIRFPIVQPPSSSSSYAESTLFVPKKRTEKSSYQVAPLHTKASHNTVSSSEPDEFGYATIIVDKSSSPPDPAEMSSDGSGPERTPSTVARVPRSALVPNRFSSLSEGRDDLSELREIQRVQRQALRQSESFESGDLSSIDVSSRPMSSRDSSGTESLPNWTRYDHKALRRGPGLSSTSTFYLSQSSLGQPSSPQAPQVDTVSQDSTILSPEAARYAIFRERHFEQTSERAPEGSPEPEFNIAPLDRRVLDELPSPAISTPPVARLASTNRSQTSSRAAARSSTAVPARKHRSKRKRIRKHHDVAARSPHLVIDRRSAVISPWQPPQPDLPDDFEGVSMLNVQIAMFCVGFVCPFLWFIAGCLPLPQRPPYASSRQRAKRRGNEKDLESTVGNSRRNAEQYWQEKQHDRVRWWRNVNRVMSIVGIVIIIIFIVVAVITIR